MPSHPLFTSQPEPHLGRTRQMLKDHPELAELFGPWQGTALLLVLLVAAQVAAAWALRDAHAGWLLLAAWTGGAFANHAAWVLLHECSHNLVFERPRANLLLSLVGNLPIVVPSAISFRRYHLLHHRFQGDPAWDADLPSPLEQWLGERGAAGKAAWLALFPLLQVHRVLKLRNVPMVDGWFLANVAVQLAFTAAVVNAWGLRALAYLLASTWFSVGMHPLGARWVQEHFLVHPQAPAQETSSYYGPLNVLAFNVGYHVEHHDLMRVAWLRLPRLREMAPGYYGDLASHTSWVRLWGRFLLDRSITLRSRVVRGPEVVPNWTGSTLGTPRPQGRPEELPLPPAQSA